MKKMKKFLKAVDYYCDKIAIFWLIVAGGALGAVVAGFFVIIETSNDEGMLK